MILWLGGCGHLHNCTPLSLSTAHKGTSARVPQNPGWSGRPGPPVSPTILSRSFLRQGLPSSAFGCRELYEDQPVSPTRLPSPWASRSSPLPWDLPKRRDDSACTDIQSSPPIALDSGCAGVLDAPTCQVPTRQQGAGGGPVAGQAGLHVEKGPFLLPLSLAVLQRAGSERGGARCPQTCPAPGPSRLLPQDKAPHLRTVGQEEALHGSQSPLPGGFQTLYPRSTPPPVRREVGAQGWLHASLGSELTTSTCGLFLYRGRKEQGTTWAGKLWAQGPPGAPRAETR